MRRKITAALAALIAAALVPAASAENPWPYAEDAAHASGDRGNMCLAVRKDTAAALAGTDGDYIPLSTNSTGALYVTTTGGPPAPGYVEDAAETAGATLSMCGTVRRDTAASSAGTTGDNATLNTDATGNLWVVSAVLEDAAETAANPLLGVGTVRRDTAASSAGTTGDNATLNTDATGQLWVHVGTIDAGTNAIGKLAANSGVDIGDVDVASIAAGANVIGKVSTDITTPGTTNSVAIITGQDGIAGGTGVDGATVPRVTLATNVALPAGTNAIGKLAANSGVDIGDVDVTSIAAGTNNIGDVDVEILGTAASYGTAGTLVVADATVIAAAANTRVYGCLVMEDAGTPAAAVGILRHDTVAATCDGDAIMSIRLAASGQTSLDFGARGLAVPSGVCLDVTSGSFSINCWSSVEAAP